MFAYIPQIYIVFTHMYRHRMEKGYFNEIKLNNQCVNIIYIPSRPRN